ncbi:hypothetical protein BH18ACT4_BH18ACT4_08290 [soil metagenome]
MPLHPYGHDTGVSSDPEGCDGSDRVLDAIVGAAVEATEASAGWLLSSGSGDLVAVAAAGAGAAELVGRTAPSESSTTRFVVASGQPMALSAASAASDRAGGNPGVGAVAATASSVLCVPCLWDEAVVGALELVDKSGGSSFSYEDLELVTLLARVAAAALAGPGPDRSP